MLRYAYIAYLVKFKVRHMLWWTIWSVKCCEIGDSDGFIAEDSGLPKCEAVLELGFSDISKKSIALILKAEEGHKGLRKFNEKQETIGRRTTSHTSEDPKP